MLKRLRVTMGKHEILGMNFNRNSVIMRPMPEALAENSHLTFMKYIDPNHKYYGKFDFHTTRLVEKGFKKHLPLAGPWSPSDFQKKAIALNTYLADSQVEPDSIKDYGNFYTIKPNVISSIARFEQLKRTLNVNINEDMPNVNRFLSGVEANALPHVPFLYAAHEDDPNILLVVKNGRCYIFKKQELFGTIRREMGFNLRAFDLLKA